MLCREAPSESRDSILPNGKLASMFASWWSGKPKEQFSLDNLKYLHNQLTKNPIIHDGNKELITEVLRSVAELMIWGDQHNSAFFDYFCEKNMLGFFPKIMHQRTSARVKVQLIQTLSIMIQNISSEHAIFYFLSNNHLNDIIVYKFDFSDEEIVSYYISFLKTLSFKLNKFTLPFFFNERANDFPLYTEALKFFQHPESMVRVAVRTLTLNVFQVDDPGLRNFILNRSAVPYFSNLVWFMRDQCLSLDALLATGTYLDQAKLSEQIEQRIDHFYYLEDIFQLNVEPLSQALTDQLLAHFILPMLIGALLDSQDPEAPSIAQLEVPHNTPNPDAKLNDDAGAAMDVFVPQRLNFPLSPSSSSPEASVAADTASIETAAVTSGGASVAPLEVLVEKSSTVALSPSPLSPAALSAPPKRRLSRPLALYLLSQLLTIFRSNAPLINACAAALIHPRPPVALERLVINPPQYPVKDKLPLTEVLWSPAPAASTNSETDSVGGASIVLVSPAPASIFASPDTPVADAPAAEPAESKPTQLPDLSSPLVEAGKIERPVDENLRARSQLPQMGLIASPSEQIPNFRARTANNPFRDAMVAALASGDHDTLVFGVGSVLLNLLRNPCVDERLLVEAELCTMAHRRRLHLLSALMGDAVHVAEPTEPVRASQESVAAVPVAEELAAVDSVEPSSNSAPNETEASTENASDPLMDKAPSSKTVIRLGSSVGASSPLIRPTDSTSTPSTLTPHVSSVVRSDAENEDDSHLQNTTNALLGALLDALRRPWRLITVQLILELVVKLCGSTPAQLLPAHRIKLLLAHDQAKTDLRTRLQESTVGDAFLDSVEDESRALLSTAKPPNVTQIVASPVTLLPIAESAISGIDFDYRLPAGDVERIRRSLQVFLLLHHIRQRLIPSEELASSISSNTAASSAVPPVTVSSFLACLTPAPLTAEDMAKPIDMSGLDLIPCLVMVGQRRQRLFVVADSTQQHLLMVEQHPTQVGFATLQLRVPLHDQEALRSRNDFRVLQLVLRTPLRPHPGCVMIQGTHQKPLWQINLYFDDRVQCANAAEFLERSRESRRRQMMEQLLEILNV